MSDYAELHCVSNFSFLRGASQPGELVRQAARLGYRALALTDECSMAGAVRAWEAWRELKSESFRLIVGAEFRTTGQLQLVLLAPDQAAYSQICRLITLARRRSKKGCYRLDNADLASGLDQCLALWMPSPASPAEEGHWLRGIFGERLWLAVALHREAGDREQLATLLQLARDCNLPAVAAGDVHMHRRSRRPLQDVLTAIRHQCTVAEAGARLFANGERHLRPLAVLQKLYPVELLRQSVLIAERCRFHLGELKYQYPPELVPGGQSAIEHLRVLTRAGQQWRWPQGTPPAIQATIDRELVLIEELRYEHFFLTVHDIVRHAREALQILCQGRGSAANSAVCYALGITEVNPDQMTLLFERFISRERCEPPDIDVDFEHERREEVIQYIYRKYGRERTALAATVICYRGRSARRDVAKALGLDPEAPPPRGTHRQFDALVEALRGFPRHLSQHVGGFVITGQPLHELVPIENAAMPERTVIQWDKDDLDAVGLLKVDVLALGMLSAIRRTLQFIEKYGGPVRMQDVPSDDAATYGMIGRAETVGVFQIESRAQMSMLPRLKPQNFYDLVIEVAIVRPGPIQGGMVHPYLRRRTGEEPAHYPSEALRGVLGRTLGVPIFQEQVMQIAVVAADFTPGEADQLRRSMAAWKRKGGLGPWEGRLREGMLRNGYAEPFIRQIFQQISGFGEYGFPESHAASFALLTWVSCWLKCHHPAAFIAGLLNSQPMGFYHPAQLLQEARRSGVTVLPPDVRHSDWDYTLEPAAGSKPSLRIGLRQISGMKEADARRIVQQREAGPCRDAQELAQRAQLSRPCMQRLAGAGALAAFSEHRHQAMWQALGIEKLPALLAGAAARESLPALPAPTEAQLIKADYQRLQLSTGRHPLALLRPWLRRRRIHNREELQQLADGSAVRVAGLVTHMQRPGTASGVTFVSLEDETGIVNVIIWLQVFEAQQDTALAANLLVVEGVLQRQQQVLHVVARNLHDRSHWLGPMPRRSRDFR